MFLYIHVPKGPILHDTVSQQLKQNNQSFHPFILGLNGSVFVISPVGEVAVAAAVAEEHEVLWPEAKAGVAEELGAVAEATQYCRTCNCAACTNDRCTSSRQANQSKLMCRRLTTQTQTQRNQ